MCTLLHVTYCTGAGITVKEDKTKKISPEEEEIIIEEDESGTGIIE